MAALAALAARAALLLLVLGANTATSDCFGVFCVAEIKDCPNEEQDVCGTLEVTHEPGQSVDNTSTTKLQGDKVGYKVGLNKKALKNVIHVQQSGRGCYKIFEGKKFNGKQMMLVGNIKHEHKEGWNIKSIDYDINCWPQGHGASLPAWVIGLAVVIVVGVGVIIVLVMYCRKNKEATRDLILRMTGTQDTPVKCDTCKGTVGDNT